ncbi:uncharacterized protein LOC111776286 [Cucurbita pepo subsp. pepo]|uniref:uncharacterized protein LOC111776286 n=1 Tax=Cucurbita pepo subsp. pepo TaxID=3664 RepID=UPI000C9D81F4|nr:uncharacterized protein LOC111776286 [Cucurbita pepo subsp. pepo]
MAEEDKSTDDTFVHDTCNRFQYNELYKLCIPEIDLDPREDLKSNLTGFLTIFVNHTINNFNDNLIFLQREIKSGKLDAETKLMYDKCSESFGMGYTKLQESMHILLTQPGTNVYDLPTMSVDKRISVCFDDFEDDPIPPEWQSRYKTSWNLVSLILGTSNLIKCNREASCIP